jgi:hypothetical protein
MVGVQPHMSLPGFIVQVCPAGHLPPQVFFAASYLQVLAATWQLQLSLPGFIVQVCP